jgi:hypothetical protein
MELSRLTKLPLRSIWKHEALLSDTIGVELLNAQTEVGVGQFHVDILAEDENGHKVVIENQIEPTNHDHLGKLITYASGLGAEVVIWIVSRAREEHEQAINWLNDNTTEHANFFLIEIEAWKIGDSPPAPKFSIIAKPNDWAKTIKQSGTGNKVTELKLQQQAFWEKFRDYGEQHAKLVKSWQKPHPQHWYDISVGTAKAHLSATVNTNDKLVGFEVYISNDKELFHKLFAKKDEIESKLDLKLEWNELPGKKASRILFSQSGDMLNESEVPKLIEWFTQMADNFTKVFPKYF